MVYLFYKFNDIAVYLCRFSSWYMLRVNRYASVSALWAMQMDIELICKFADKIC